jgi:hypothetical protein
MQITIETGVTYRLSAVIFPGLNGGQGRVPRANFGLRHEEQREVRSEPRA